MGEATDEQDDEQFRVLLDYLRRARGFDFDGYKPAGLARRIERRMHAVNVPSFGEYVDYLEVHPDEFAQLFNTILINVTSFFRDPLVWEFVRREVVPALVRSRADGRPIRVWSAGCASGEEAYTLAIALAEELGVEAFKHRVKVYATDVDDEALAQARQATYAPRDLEHLPEALRGKYFDPLGDRLVFNKELRRSVIFGRHNLLNDAPISRVDLLVSRNTLMYFNAEAQARILTRFHFAMNDDAYLILGRAETLLSHTNLFAPVDLRRRVFRKVAKAGLRDRLYVLAQAGGYDGSDGAPDGAPHGAHHAVRETALDAGPVAQVVVAADGSLAAANARARALFRLAARDVGQPLQDLEISYRPVELRSAIERAHAERRPVAVREVEWPVDGERLNLEVTVSPLFDATGVPLGTSVTYADVTPHRRLQADLERSHQELEAAYEELQSTSEELETTNEELQSTVEELETTNEELQSTNEELETMNEELQSTNEELQTTNDELRQRSVELNEANAFLNAILSGFKTGVIVLDRELRVQAWNPRSEDLWGLRRDEVHGQYFGNLDIGLPVHQLLPDIRECGGGGGDGEASREVTIRATTRRGRTVECRVSCTTLRGADGEPRGVILLLDDGNGG